MFASGKFSVLNEGVTLSSPGRALQTANEREDVSLNVMGVIAATDDANGGPGFGIFAEDDNTTIHGALVRPQMAAITANASMTIETVGP